jgi:hypothetical protein
VRLRSPHRPEALTQATHTGRKARPYLLLCATVAALTAALLVYSQTKAFAWDEGFHLLAAQLIKAGRKPYLDFCFSQTPLNAYWNAGWMWVFGENWRTPHAVAALLTAGAVLLTADFVFTRLPVTNWRFAAALTAAALTALNITVFEYGTIAQAYGICLFLTVAAFRLAILIPNREGWLLPAGAGFLASAAAGSSLLTATVAPVLLAWLLIYNRTGNRWAKFAALVAGALVPLLPVLWLLVQSPQGVWFGIFEYNGLYRRADWPDATRHNIEVLTYWIDSSQALTLGLLAAVGIFFIFKSDWDRARRAEFYLCGWLAAATAAELCIPHPTFQRYFLLVVPFLAALAAVGLYAVTLRTWNSALPAWPVLAVTLLVVLGLAKSLDEKREVYTWPYFEQIARKVDEVTPPGGVLFADEQIYFLTGRRPPSGFELADSHKLELLPPDVARALHIVPKSEVDRRIASRVFDTIATFEDDEDVLAAWGLSRHYAHKSEVGDCTVYWGRVPAKSVASSGAPSQ